MKHTRFIYIKFASNTSVTKTALHNTLDESHQVNTLLNTLGDMFGRVEGYVVCGEITKEAAGRLIENEIKLRGVCK